MSWEDQTMRGWQPFLTPRQMRIILCRLAATSLKELGPQDREEFLNTLDWFEGEVDTKYSIEERRESCL